FEYPEGQNFLGSAMATSLTVVKAPTRVAFTSIPATMTTDAQVNFQVRIQSDFGTINDGFATLTLRRRTGNRGIMEITLPTVNVTSGGLASWSFTYNDIFNNQNITPDLGYDPPVDQGYSVTIKYNGSTNYQNVSATHSTYVYVRPKPV